ncbi:hypothetical protein LOC68_22890 [Blastopirellula sp. JC732]|uniref:Secreted protein n=1 Tax=Blastopirellula sediminis TaxID=2894196 RepID=A0A9X1MRX8_9BACT|nr:hypothetical protein [Blastopirellula sediminis]MCC9605450.1 hypothetical protein [Blastopirellula sediminis]MCC9631250.1 hypothetical protein [Blastopirellula sediminis]
MKFSLITLFGSVVILALICGFAEEASAQFPKIKNTPFDTNTWPKVKIGSGNQNNSNLMVYSPPYIDANGNVYSATSNTGQTARYLGKAKIEKLSDGCYYVAYVNGSGRITRKTKCPSWMSSNNTGGNIQFDNQVKKKKIQKPSSQSTTQPLTIPQQTTNSTSQQNANAQLAAGILDLIGKGIQSAQENERRQQQWQQNQNRPYQQQGYPNWRQNRWP